MSRIAIMQPYFMPYAGYFRLFVDTDLFVIYDDVQFPKEGWVHRNKLLNRNQEPAWLTLPLRRASLSTRILDMVYDKHAEKIWQERMRKFPIFDKNRDPLVTAVQELGDKPVDYLVRCMELVTSRLSLPFNTVRSSDLDLRRDLMGQDRVLEIVSYLGGREYLNLQGGRSLYRKADFRARNLELTFLPDYSGNMASILQRLLTEDPGRIRAEIQSNMVSG